MAIIKNPVTVTGSDREGEDIINGVIKKYLATTNAIDANTFIEFVGGPSSGQGTQIVNPSGAIGVASAVAIDDNRVLVLFPRDTTNSFLYGVVCTVDGATVTKGTTTQLSSIKYSGRYPKATIMSDGSVFVVFSGTPSNYYYPYGLVCKIGDSGTITAEPAVQLTTTTGSTLYAPSVGALNANKVFVAYGNMSNGGLFAAICTIDGSAVTSGVRTQLMSSGSSADSPVAVVLDDEKAVVVAGYEQSIRAVTCKISTTIITSGAVTSVLTNMNDAYSNSATKLNSDKILVAGCSNNRIYGSICTIDDITITTGVLSQLVEIGSNTPKVVMTSLNEYEVVIAYPHIGDNLPYAALCSIVSNAIMVEKETAIDSRSNVTHGAGSTATLLSDDNIFFTYNYGSNGNIYGRSIGFEVKVTSATSKIFNGLTKTKCTTEVPGEVWTGRDLSVPSLSNLLYALRHDFAEDIYPPGTEIPDTHGSNNSPLIVGVYKNNNGRKMIGMLRKYVVPSPQAFGSNPNYATSDILVSLNSDYLESCSDELRAHLMNVVVPWYDGSNEVQVSGKWHLFSATEVMGVGKTTEGEAWPYWKQKTGLVAPTNASVPGRVVYDNTGTARPWWTRTRATSTNVYYVGNTAGNIFDNNNASSTLYILPMCYISVD